MFQVQLHLAGRKNEAHKINLIYPRLNRKLENSEHIDFLTQYFIQLVEMYIESHRGEGT